MNELAWWEIIMIVVTPIAMTVAICMLIVERKCTMTLLKDADGTVVDPGIWVDYDPEA